MPFGGALPEPVLNAQLNILGLNAGVGEQAIDSVQLIDPVLIIDIAFDGGQSRLEVLLERNDVAIHGARVYPSWRSATQK